MFPLPQDSTALDYGLGVGPGASQVDNLLLSQDANFQGAAAAATRTSGDNPFALTIDGLGFTDVGGSAGVGAPTPGTNPLTHPGAAPLSQF